MSEKIKAWITWPDHYVPGFCYCVLILENGFVPYGHLCSNPDFALGDLWTRKPERQKVWLEKKLELEIVGCCPDAEVPPHVVEAYQSGAYMQFRDTYFPKPSWEKDE